MTKTSFFRFAATIPDGQAAPPERGTLTMPTNRRRVSFFFPQEFCNGRTRHLVSLLSGSASISPRLFHPNEEAERKGHDARKPPGSTLCSPAEQGQDGLKRNSVANSAIIVLPGSNWASLGDPSHDVGRKRQLLCA